MKRRRPLTRWKKFQLWYRQPFTVAGSAVLAVSIAALGALSIEVQQMASAEAARALNGVATEDMLSGASECTRKYLNMNFTRNELVVMAEDVKNMESNCKGLERHKAMIQAQREALTDHTETNRALAQGTPASAAASN